MQFGKETGRWGRKNLTVTKSAYRKQACSELHSAKARRVNAVQLNGPFHVRNYLNYQINDGWSFFIGQFLSSRTTLKQRGPARNHPTHERGDFRPARERNRVLNFLLCINMPHVWSRDCSIAVYWSFCVFRQSPLAGVSRRTRTCGRRQLWISDNAIPRAPVLLAMRALRLVTLSISRSVQDLAGRSFTSCHGRNVILLPLPRADLRLRAWTARFVFWEFYNWLTLSSVTSRLTIFYSIIFVR